MIELQTIVNDSLERLYSLKIPPHKFKAIYDIESCRTSKLGSHIDICPSCEHTKISYNSCRNRHCPKCQNIAKEEWVESRRSELLNVQYFHVVFTVPDSLNSIFYRNQKAMYNLLFMCVSETLKELAYDEKYLGAEIGTTCVLHTWGQNLMYHPHIHCIVPGGGLSKSGVDFRKSRKKFFIPVKVLSRKFRGKLMHFLNIAISTGKVILPKDIDYTELKSEIYKKEWVVYCKPPFKTPSHVIEYLGRYTHKIAISNSRIVAYEDGKVTFKWRDYKDNNTQKFMTLDSLEFLRRFLLHILPEKFVKIRHYGILGNRNKKTKLRKCQKLTGVKIETLNKLSKRELLKTIFGYDVLCCPHCGFEIMNRYFLKPDWKGG